MDDIALLFNTLDAENDGVIRVSDLRDALLDTGLKESIVSAAIKRLDPKKARKLTLDEFREVEKFESDVVVRALRDIAYARLSSLPVFIDTRQLEKIYNEVAKNESGEKAQYIPQLARINPDQFGVSVYTIDSQVWSHGDVDVQFTVQSCSKPITYAMAETELGVEKIRAHVGHEPSGKAFELDSQNLPHNPMINAGAIMTASLLKPELEPADRFDYVLDVWRRLAGGDGCRIGFDNGTYLSELRHADRNFALAYFMDAGAFGENVVTSDNVQANLEFYFQCCSIFATCEDMASIGAALANGGIHPTTQEVIFSPQTVRNTLALMFSCGMYDYSGEFSYSVGLPAKSGVAGCILCVVPNLMSVCTWSPRLDSQGNSVRGVDFFTRLTQRFSLHVFDDTSSGACHKKDVRKRMPGNPQLLAITEMCYAAANGDIPLLASHELAGDKLSSADYDGRTPLHLAAAEGRALVVEWLLGKGVDTTKKDRYGATPLEEAQKYGHTKVVELLQPKA